MTAYVNVYMDHVAHDLKNCCQGSNWIDERYTKLNWTICIKYVNVFKNTSSPGWLKTYRLYMNDSSISSLLSPSKLYNKIKWYLTLEDVCEIFGIKRCGHMIQRQLNLILLVSTKHVERICWTNFTRSSTPYVHINWKSCVPLVPKCLRRI